MPHWWQGIFHNQSALALKLRSIRRDTVVINVPFHLSDDPDCAQEQAESLGLSREHPEQRPTVDRIDPTIDADRREQTSDSLSSE